MIHHCGNWSHKLSIISKWIHLTWNWPWQIIHISKEKRDSKIYPWGMPLLTSCQLDFPFKQHTVSCQIEIQQSIWEGCLQFQNIRFCIVNVFAAQYQKPFADPCKQCQWALLDQVTLLKYPSHEVAGWCMNVKWPFKNPNWWESSRLHVLAH